MLFWKMADDLHCIGQKWLTSSPVIVQISALRNPSEHLWIAQHRLVHHEAQVRARCSSSDCGGLGLINGNMGVHGHGTASAFFDVGNSTIIRPGSQYVEVQRRRSSNYPVERCVSTFVGRIILSKGHRYIQGTLHLDHQNLRIISSFYKLKRSKGSVLPNFSTSQQAIMSSGEVNRQTVGPCLHQCAHAYTSSLIVVLNCMRQYPAI